MGFSSFAGCLAYRSRHIDEKSDIRLIHHSGRGCQYASSDYVSILNDRHIRISMTESGDPKDNAQAERVNNTVKNELLKDMHFASIGEVVSAVARAVDFYNNEHPHMSIDLMTPSMAARCDGEIPKRWISYRERAIRKKQAQVPKWRVWCPSPSAPISRRGQESPLWNSSMKYASRMHARCFMWRNTV